MMKNRLITILIAVLSVSVYGQNSDAFFSDMAEGILQIRQKPGTEKFLTEYLSGIKSDKDTIYAMIYIPSYCRRCEVTIPSFYKKMKRISPDDDVILITAYKDADMSRHYNKKNGYKADQYLYDTNCGYERIFNFNTNGMLGLYILKICKSSGELIIGGDPTSINDEFVGWLTKFNMSIEKKIFQANNNTDFTKENIPEPKFDFINSNNFVEYTVNTNKDFPLSSCKDSPVFKNGLFFYNDELSDGIMVFNKNGNNIDFRTMLQVDSVERVRFVNVPQDVYNNMKKEKQVFYIPIYPNLSEDGKWIEISYSLPDLSMESDDEGNRFVAYYNAPVIIRRNAETFKPGPMYMMDFEITSSDFMNFHFNYNIIGDTMFFGCKKKAWPLDIPLERYKNVSHMDPFMPEFYDTPNPYMAAYDRKTGKQICQFGNIDNYARNSLTGYAFIDPKTAVNKKEVAYTDGYSGRVTVADISDLRKTKEKYRLFDIAVENFPLQDSSLFYKEEYRKLYNKFFYRKINAIEFTDSFISCIIHYGMPTDTDEKKTDNYVFAVINRQTGETKQYRIPRYDNTEIMEYGLTMQRQDMYSPFVFFKEKNGYKVRVFK